MGARRGLATDRVPGVLGGALVLLVAVWVQHGRQAGSWPLLLFTTLLVAFVFWTHRENIGRLRRGEEKRISAGHGAEKLR
jgi:glycerol-3-phosphate acyltransferase PlsY